MTLCVRAPQPAPCARAWREKQLGRTVLDTEAETRRRRLELGSSSSPQPRSLHPESPSASTRVRFDELEDESTSSAPHSLLSVGRCCLILAYTSGNTGRGVVFVF